jgi:FkbM family methyltransferase
MTQTATTGATPGATPGATTAAIPPGTQLVGGVYLPAGETHLVHWMTKGKRARLVDGQATYQYHKLEVCLAHLPAARRRLALDIGAHVGLWSMQLVKHFERLEAFEPVALHRALFRLNVGQLDKWRLHPVALGAAPGRVALSSDPASSGDTHVIGAGEIPMVTLDSLEIAGPLDFIKIDTEGYELPILTGALETINRHRPLILVEQKGKEAEHFGAQPGGARGLLAGLGMVQLAEISGDYLLGWP